MVYRLGQILLASLHYNKNSIMKTKKIVSFVCIAVFCITPFSCKKDKSEPAPVTKKYLPSAIAEQKTSTSAPIYNISFTYNKDASLSSITQASTSRTITWSLNYNANGSLNTASQSESGSSPKNVSYVFSYGANDKLNKVVSSGSVTDVLNLNYNAATNTYGGSGGAYDGVSLRLNTAGQVDNIQNWTSFQVDMNLVYQSDKKGVFADVNMDESVKVFLNIYNNFPVAYSFFHSQEVTRTTFGTNNYLYQNYNRNADKYISTYQVDRSASSTNYPRSYTVSYTEQ